MIVVVVIVVLAMIASRPKAAKGSSGSAPLYSALLKEAQDAEKERKLQNEQGSTMRDDAPKVVSKSSLLEEEDDFGNSKAEKVSRSTRGGRGAGASESLLVAPWYVENGLLRGLFWLFWR